jgi:antitoxin (DNA-binding transcriptional repressor) of toxin-antitoxin stability system
VPTLPVSAAQSHLSQVIAGLTPGETLVLVENGAPVATLTKVPRTQWPSKAGSAKGTGYWMAPDFDAPLEEFREYME